MFEAWGRWVFRRRRATLVVSGVFLLVSVVLLIHGGHLATKAIHGIEADDAVNLMDRELPSSPASGFTVIFRSDSLTTGEDAFGQAVLAAVLPLRSDPSVASVRTPFDKGTSIFLATGMQSADGHAVVAEVTLRPEAVLDTSLFPPLREKIRGGPLTVTVTGPAAFRSDLDQALAADLQRSEVLSAPVTFAVLLFVFGSLVAASLPLGVGALAVVGGIALVMLLSRFTEVAQYAINIVSLVGLGVAIDYSLFMVARFREEIAGGAEVPDALARTVATAGRAVVFSGVAVAIGLGGLLFFRGSFLASLGAGGTIVVVLSVVYALTFLPALLAVLGRNVDRLRVYRGTPGGTHRRWHRLATAVMRHPVLVLIPTLALLVAAGRPFLDIALAVPDVHILPPGSEAKRGDAILREAFPERVATRMAVLVSFPGDPFGTPERAGALYDLSREIATVPGVTEVESVLQASMNDDRDAIVAALSGPRASLPEPMRVVAQETVGRTVFLLAALTDAPPTSAEAHAIVDRIRLHRHVADGTLLVTGQTAMDMDSTTYIQAHVPKALAFVFGMTLLLLFALLGSVVLPFKAVAMNLLSLTASFGALVWVFQKGHLAGVLHFTPGPIDPGLPIVLFCATFGLSMDYEVLLLTRIQEEWDRTGDNTHAVAEGLERVGPLITSAAALMVAVFSAFAIADVVILKIMGVATALTVALDATIVRSLLVPATMRLLGHFNWWAPEFLLRIRARVKPHPPGPPPRRQGGGNVN
ncbi:MAG: MMPL family transporter, partial [Polyangiaceae bacterium]